MPFCPTICPFCSFEVRERRAGDVAAYLAELGRELRQVAATHDVAPLRSVYLGGGTPSYLRVAELDRLLGLVSDTVAVRSDAEVTLEVHPSTVDPERARAWVDLGVNRLSIGAQSFDDDVLRRLGRPHDAAAARFAVEACQAAGAAIVSVDLITAVEGQDLDRELDAVVALGVDHVSAYTLTIEEGTPFERAGVRVDDQVAADALIRTAGRLGAAGFEHDEVSNHARPGARSVHNRAYWENRCFVGVGPGAASHLPVFDEPGVLTERRVNPGWAEWSVGERGPAEPRDAVALLGDGLLCGLRLVEGADLDALAAQTGVDAAARHREEIERLVDDGLVELVATPQGRRLRATDAGRLVLDRVTAALV